jgi:hypothetical protein
MISGKKKGLSPFAEFGRKKRSKSTSVFPEYVLVTQNIPKTCLTKKIIMYHKTIMVWHILIFFGGVSLKSVILVESRVLRGEVKVRPKM